MGGVDKQGDMGWVGGEADSGVVEGGMEVGEEDVVVGEEEISEGIVMETSGEKD